LKVFTIFICNYRCDKIKSGSGKKLSQHAQIQQTGKKEGVWGGNFCQRLLSAEGGVSVWGLSVYAPPPSSSSVGGAKSLCLLEKSSSVIEQTPPIKRLVSD